MHGNAKSHSPHFGPSWSMTNVSISLLLALFLLILLLLFMTITAPPAYGQQSVPATAREAATMPQFAAKLGRRAQPHSPQIASRAPQAGEPRASYKHPADAPKRNHPGWPLDNNSLYENGPINGTNDGWTLNNGFVVSNTFTAPGGGNGPSGLTFGAWAFPGDVLQTVEVSITSSEFGGTVYSDQVLSFTQSGCSGNQYGYNVCTETSSNFTGPNLVAGTYWMNLQNAVVNTADPIYWDENSGIGCSSPGCPSEASENSVGTIPSEAFTILGSSTESECLQGVHNFDASEGSPAPGLAFDHAGNLYGATISGGANGFGLAYKLAVGANWAFSSLYSFLGGLGGETPAPGIIGPEGAVYGTADGGLQQCGSSGNTYCGIVYRLRPSAFACPTVLCGWTEQVIYRFTGDPDGWKPNADVVFDEAGNLYGITNNGGAYGQGTVFELTPSNGGWTEHVIYSLTGDNGNGRPVSLLMGSNGSLYGAAGPRGDPAVIFQLAPSGGSWTENILASFNGCVFSGNGGSCNPVLSRERDGVFYGFYTYSTWYCNFPPCYWATFGRVFLVYPSGGIGILDDTYGSLGGNTGIYDIFEGVAVDGVGRVYATEGHLGTHLQCGSIELVPGDHECVSDGGGCLCGDNKLFCTCADIFYGRDLEADAFGDLYGTLGPCGGSKGTVWRATPRPGP